MQAAIRPDRRPQRRRRRHPVGRRRQGQDRRLADRPRPGRRALPGRPQRRPHAGHRRPQDGAAADPVGRHARRRGLLHRQRRRRRPGAPAAARSSASSSSGSTCARGCSCRESCPLILPFHVELDRAREALRESSGSGKIGTTGKGIGPAYEDKVARRALRVQDLKHPAALRGQAARTGRAAQRRADQRS